MKKISFCFIIFLAFLVLNPFRYTLSHQSSEDNPHNLSFKITPKILVKKSIDPMIYGNFIELGFGRQPDGMWAEKLLNRSFEIFPPYKRDVFKWSRSHPEYDLTREDWWHTGYEHNHWYAVETAYAKLTYRRYWGFYHGLQAARLENKAQSKKAYLAQDGIYLNAGIDYQFSGWFCTGNVMEKDPPEVEVLIGLYHEKDFTKPVAEKTIKVTESPFRKFELVLPNLFFEGRATFAISIGPGKEVNLDGLSLMPSDSISGWRKEVIKALHKVNPPIIRFPGGCFASFYDWRDGIGPYSERKPQESEYWGGLENNDVGTAEFIKLCRLVNAEPFICVNTMTGSAQDAAAWVAYCNKDKLHPMGDLRQSHGYELPFHVKYWELDNETYRRFGPLEYAKRCVEFSKAMKKIDPTIKLVLVGYWRFNEYLAEMLEIAGEHIDIITDRALSEEQLRNNLKIISEYNKKHDRDIRLCNTEWIAPRKDVPVVPYGLNRHAGSQLERHNRLIRWKYAMNVANALMTFQTLGGEFQFANFNNMANTWGQNVIECPKEKVYLSASGKIFELMSRSPAAWPLRIETDDSDREIKVQASWDANKENLVIVALNYKDSSADLKFDISSLGLKPKKMRITILHADSPASFNSPANPDTIQRHERNIQLKYSDWMEISAPPFSVIHTVLYR